MNVAIKVENLSKVYQIGQIGTGTISRDIERWWITRVMGRDDPFLKLAATNDRTVKSESNVVWSLKDINCEIQQGDAVGIIGRNGAGKTTLLKLLSRVTSPTTGTIKIRGRVASLLEVGTGFHPELTGRENIYLNGSILGMRKKEIDRKFDEIVDFSGVELYIDTPVKRYSVGMSVRLAFAVAAHLESEILIVDEVLAVGDAEFQKKCLGKMEEVGKQEGRTVLFVSHNMSAVRNLCNTGVLIVNGEIRYSGATDSAIAKYVHSNTQNNLDFPMELGNINLDKFEYKQDGLNHLLCFDFAILKQVPLEHYVKLSIKSAHDEIIFENSQRLDTSLPNRRISLQYESDLAFLQNGDYKIYLTVFEHGMRWLIRDEFLLEITKYISVNGNVNHFGIVTPMGDWSSEIHSTSLEV
jgi:ABC-type polysaccharide/polyol phosphate transport system ATPase subunit